MKSGNNMEKNLMEDKARICTGKTQCSLNRSSCNLLFGHLQFFFLSNIFALETVFYPCLVFVFPIYKCCFTFRKHVLECKRHLDNIFNIINLERQQRNCQCMRPNSMKSCLELPDSSEWLYSCIPILLHPIIFIFFCLSFQ